MELKVEKEKVVKAAMDCPTAAVVLKTLFPEAFQRSIDLTKLEFNPSGMHKGEPLFRVQSVESATGLHASLMEIRSSGPYEGKAFWLSSGFNWELKTDNCRSNKLEILIPTLK